MSELRTHTANMDYGVTQASVLGPLLFSINLDVNRYADDTQSMKPIPNWLQFCFC